ncbi:unnamed protein product [Protopolystoma xenopodis]|uniref:Uncharacterized protein n=1 Tax=Protopolystoma xenopodis TaxID=117903 RepID=A0A448WX56_9PLAT|nr:unnamed protein product [Protopolystoma xenopodis]
MERATDDPLSARQRSIRQQTQHQTVIRLAQSPLSAYIVKQAPVAGPGVTSPSGVFHSSTSGLKSIPSDGRGASLAASTTGTAAPSGAGTATATATGTGTGIGSGIGATGAASGTGARAGGATGTGGQISHSFSLNFPSSNTSSSAALAGGGYLFSEEMSLNQEIPEAGSSTGFAGLSRRVTISGLKPGAPVPSQTETIGLSSLGNVGQTGSGSGGSESPAKMSRTAILLSPNSPRRPLYRHKQQQHQQQQQQHQHHQLLQHAIGVQHFGRQLPQRNHTAPNDSALGFGFQPSRLGLEGRPASASTEEVAGRTATTGLFPSMPSRGTALDAELSALELIALGRAGGEAEPRRRATGEGEGMGISGVLCVGAATAPTSPQLGPERRWPLGQLSPRDGETVDAESRAEEADLSGGFGCDTSRGHEDELLLNADLEMEQETETEATGASASASPVKLLRHGLRRMSAMIPGQTVPPTGAEEQGLEARATSFKSVSGKANACSTTEKLSWGSDY